jgi:hypothetical protein
MRDLILGVFLGVWITMFLTWLERHKMGADIVFYIVTALLVILLFWRFILKFIAHTNPELWYRINKFFETPKYDAKMRRLLALRKAKREVKK